jgi:Concanavalin A-like lectin/glucanases superfamily
MAISVVNVAQAAGASVTMPGHQAGDIIIVAAYRATATAPTVPTAGGTVPAWTTINAAGANSLSMTVVWAVATASNHTTGAFTNATQIIVLVLRSSAGTLSFGATAIGNGTTSATTIIYPALTLQSTAGLSMGVRIGIRATAGAAVGTAPTSYVVKIAQPVSPGTLISAHSRDNLVAHMTADSVTQSGAAAYRAVSVEVKETIAPKTVTQASVLQTRAFGSSTLTAPLPVPLNETVIDDFNRAQAKINVGAGASLWESYGLKGDTNPDKLAGVYNNTVTPSSSVSAGGVSKNKLAQDFDLLWDCAVAFSGNGGGFHVCGSKFDLSTYDGYSLFFGGTQANLYRYTNGSIAVIVFNVAGQAGIVAGDTIWLAKRGARLTLYRRPSGGSFALIGTGTDSVYDRSGLFSFEISPNVRWDNLRGGPIVVPQTLAPSSVLHGRSFGSPTLLPGAYNLAPSSTSQTRAFGSPSVVVVAPPTNYEEAVLSSGPTIFLPLQETAGTNADDISPGNHDGTYSAGVTLAQAGLVPGYLADTAVQFNGTNGRITTTYAPFTPGSSFTAEGWAVRDNNSSSHALLSSEGPSAMVILMLSSGTNEMMFYNSSLSYPLNWLNAAPNPGTPFHWALTYNDTTQVAELFVNGVSRGTKSGFAGPFPAGLGNVEWGSWGNLNWLWPGRMSYVSLCPSVLSAAKIAQHYQLGVGVLALAPPSVVHTRAIGAHALGRGPRTVTAAPVLHTRAFGLPMIATFTKLFASPVVRTRAYGVARLRLNVTVTGFTHTRAIGTPSLKSVKSVLPSPIVHSRALPSNPVVTRGAVTVRPGSTTHNRGFGIPLIHVSGAPFRMWQYSYSLKGQRGQSDRRVISPEEAFVP